MKMELQSTNQNRNIISTNLRNRLHIQKRLQYITSNNTNHI